MCEVLSVSTSGYYEWLGRSISQRDINNKALDQTIETVYINHKGNYGYPRIYKELHENDVKCSKNRVYRRMQALELKAKTKKKFRVTTDSNHNLPIKENILNRDFTANNINEKWVGDITYIHTKEGWLYLATVIDLYSRAVIGWSMDKTMTKELVCDALNMALIKRNYPSRVIVHTDRGSQYCSKEYQNIINKYNLISSMSRKGNCWDNAVAESFFKTIKSELIYHCSFNSVSEAKNEVFNYIECYYNRVRRHSAVDYRTPFEAENNLAKVA
jgi:transposase InsO family protein